MCLVHIFERCLYLKLLLNTVARHDGNAQNIGKFNKEISMEWNALSSERQDEIRQEAENFNRERELTEGERKRRASSLIKKINEMVLNI